MEENEILQKFPLFKFSCGCEIDSVEADRQRNSKAFNFDHTLHCTTHLGEGRLVCRVAKCLDCGILYQFSKSGVQKSRCNDCSIKRRRKRVNAYSKWYFKHGAYGRYKKGVNRKVEKVKTELIKTGLMPNPVIVNPKISPCLQGCQLLSENKDNTTCVHECEYRVKFLKTIYA